MAGQGCRDRLCDEGWARVVCVALVIQQGGLELSPQLVLVTGYHICAMLVGSCRTKSNLESKSCKGFVTSSRPLSVRGDASLPRSAGHQHSDVISRQTTHRSRNLPCGHPRVRMTKFRTPQHTCTAFARSTDVHTPGQTCTAFLIPLSQMLRSSGGALMRLLTSSTYGGNVCSPF